MPVQIEQRFPHCQLCGRIIPLHAEVRLTPPGGAVWRFCSQWCRDEYVARQAVVAANESDRLTEAKS